jgi:hypothetical protein
MQTPTGVRFRMHDNGVTVPVDVTTEALEDIASAPIASGGSVDRLQRYRHRFEQIASDKFDAVGLDSDDVLRIGKDDLSAYPPPR